MAAACAKTRPSELATPVRDGDVPITVAAGRTAANGEAANATALPTAIAVTDANVTEEPMTATTERSFAGTVPAPEFPPGLEWLPEPP